MAVMTSTKTIQIDHFEIPVQVQFYDWREGGRWLGGIGYKDEIICCECGVVIKIAELYDPEILIIEPNPIRLLDEWVDISKYMF